MRRYVEQRRLWHDPRKRECALASLTSLTYSGDDLSSITYTEPAADLLAMARPRRRARDGWFPSTTWGVRGVRGRGRVRLGRDAVRVLQDANTVGEQAMAGEGKGNVAGDGTVQQWPSPTGVRR